MNEDVQWGVQYRSPMGRTFYQYDTEERARTRAAGSPNRVLMFRTPDTQWREAGGRTMSEDCPVDGCTKVERGQSCPRQVADALRIAANELELADRAGVEVDVPWWWLRDKADKIEREAGR